MSWQDLLAPPGETITVPWTGGRTLLSGGRTFQVKGPLPPEHGWHVFTVMNRHATWAEPAEVDPTSLCLGKRVLGYLVGDRIIPDSATAAVTDPMLIAQQAEPVYLLEPGLDRFARIAAARHEDGRLIYVGQEFPLGPEDLVTAAFQDRVDSVLNIPHVTPALDLAFRFERWARLDAQRVREEQIRLAQEEAERVALAERRGTLLKQLGSGEGRRALARVDFGEAARAALALGGAELLDWRDSRSAGEAVVQFRLKNRRFECACLKSTLGITDAGICLVDHHSGERGDTYFTLESLPGVISQAIGLGKLVVFRHVGDDDE